MSKTGKVDTDFTLFKTAPSKSETTSSVTLGDRYEGKHEKKTKYLRPSQSSFGNGDINSVKKYNYKYMAK